VVFGHVLAYGVQDSIDVARTLRIACELELTAGIDRDEHDCGKNGDDADDDKDFDEGEAFARIN